MQLCVLIPGHCVIREWSFLVLYSSLRGLFIWQSHSHPPKMVNGKCYILVGV